MKKKNLLVLLGISIGLATGMGTVYSQDLDLESIVEEEVEKMETEPTMPKPFYTIWGHVLPTVRTLPAHILDFRVSHHFGKLAGGVATFWGLGYATDVQISFNYGFTDRLTAGFGYYRGGWIASKNLDLRVKYWLLNQVEGAPFHLSVLLVSAWSTGSVNPFDFYGPPTVATRLSFLAMPIFAYQLNKFTFQLAPYYIFSQRVPIGHPGSFFGSGITVRYLITPILAFLVEGAYTFNPPYEAYVPMMAVGITLLTGGHVFSIRFVNSRYLLENYVLPYSTSSLKDIRFAFSFSRAFSIGKKKNDQW
ncbi:MAG: hypothetical protein GXO48_04385 [Chlorobi bacterium]|nr:hypothetical protein [Chlorobiota bacterium]